MVFDNLLSRWQLSRFPSFFDEDQNWLMMPRDISGLSISEDNKGVYVEAAVPGINPDNIEVTYNRGVLWIRAEAEEEEKDKNKKYYRKSSRSFSYRVTVPGNVDESAEPNVVCKNGVVKAIFKKTESAEPRRIAVKKG